MLTIFRRAITALIFVMAVIGLAVLIGPAEGATPCNPPDGTLGKDRNGGGLFPCRDGTLLPCTGMRVGEDGQWSACAAVKPPAEAECYAEQRHRQWGGAQGDLCNSIPPGVPADIGKHILQRAPHGGEQELHDGFGNTIGRATYRCVRGTWSDEPVRASCIYKVDPAAPPASTQKPKPRSGDARIGAVPR